MISPRLLPLAALLLAGCGEDDQAAPSSPVEEPASPAGAAAETPPAEPAKTPPADVAVSEADEMRRVGEYRAWAIGLREKGVHISGTKLKDVISPELYARVQETAAR